MVPAAAVAWAAGWSLARLGRPLWFDEASTALALLPKPLRLIVTDYSAPFNHLLYTVLLRLWVGVVGRGDAETLLRLPSIAFAVGAAATAAYGFREPDGPLSEGACWLAGALLAASPTFLLFSWQIRGYSLTILLAAAMTAFYFRLGRRRGAGLGYAICGAAAIAVMPTNLLLPGTLGAAYLWTERPFDRRRWREWLGLAGPLAGFLAYAFVFDRMLAAGASMGGTLAESSRHAAGLAVESARALGYAWFLLPPALAGLFGAGGASRAARPALAAAAALLPFAFCALSRTLPYSRNMLVMLPLWCVVLAALAERGLEAVLKGAASARRAAAAACVLLAVSSAWAQRRVPPLDPALKPQDLTRAYYDSKDFRPDLAVALVKERKKQGRNAAIADADDLLSLIYYARTTDAGPVYYVGHLTPESWPKLRSRGDVLLISRDETGARDMLERLHASAAPKLVERFGFFSVFDAQPKP